MKSFHKVSSALFFIGVSFLPLRAEASLFGKCDLSQRESLTIKSFDKCSQKQLDAFYLELNAGSMIPKGSFDGKVQLAKKGLIPNLFDEAEEYFLERIWKGKIFYRQNPNEAILFNRIREVNQTKERFPAHVYYGKSLFDSKKLSVVIDYAHNEDIEGYNSSVDWLVNAKGTEIRDEIRKVHNGLYLGRAYIKGKFLLNFVLQETL